MERPRPKQDNWRWKLRRSGELADTMTPAECALWEVIRGNQLGVTFSPSIVIGGYILDFYCADKRLVIEVDGPYHADQPEYDRDRDRTLKQRYRLKTLRFTNEQVLEHR